MSSPPRSAKVIPERARAFQGRRAGVVTRMTAAVLDGLVVVAIIGLVYGVVIGTAFLVDPSRFHWPGHLGWSIPVIGFGVAAPYLSLAWATTGRSWGGAVMGVRVVTARGTTLPLAKAVVRALLCVVFPIGLLWSAVNHSNRSVQDIVLRTSVIYDWTPRTDRE
jgi:uncharacterized RDD family membrane protein YckC